LWEKHKRGVFIFEDCLIKLRAVIYIMKKKEVGTMVAGTAAGMVLGAVVSGVASGKMGTKKMKKTAKKAAKAMEHAASAVTSTLKQ